MYGQATLISFATLSVIFLALYTRVIICAKNDDVLCKLWFLLGNNKKSAKNHGQKIHELQTLLKMSHCVWSRKKVTNYSRKAHHRSTLLCPIKSEKCGFCRCKSSSTHPSHLSRFTSPFLGKTKQKNMIPPPLPPRLFSTTCHQKILLYVPVLLNNLKWFWSPK